MGAGSSSDPYELRSDLHECHKEYDKAVSEGSSSYVLEKIMRNCGTVQRELDQYTSARFRK